MIKSNLRCTETFEVKVGLHQEWVLSPLMFVIVVKELTKNEKLWFPCELLYADDFALNAENEKEAKKMFE